MAPAAAIGEAARPGPWRVASCGLGALAVAMGVGRFAFTPILPMLQEEFAVTLAQAGWLASANYLGYLLGALSALHPGIRPRFAIRAGLLTIALSTAATGLIADFAAWIALRAIAGFASAWVLVCVSAWALERLGALGRPELSGAVFAGVGCGIVFAGTACLVLLRMQLGSSGAWLALGAASLCVSIALWPSVGGERTSIAGAPGGRPGRIPGFWRLVFCYGAFGLGYIIPATFLPAMARQASHDPAWFGWAWPLFGAAALLSTFLAARLSLRRGPRAVWILGNLAMACGVLVPIVLPGLAGIGIAALCVGGTFMVNTMAGLQEARRLAGARARSLMAAMTAAFAAGQIAGPLLVSALIGLRHGFSLALAAAAMPLLLAAGLLLKSR